MIYPPECAGCRELTSAPHGLCPDCWGDTTFISGPICDGCGIPVPAAGPGAIVHCEGCASHPPGWDRGRAAILYEGRGREIVLRLKHGDRLDLAPVLARWLARAGADLLDCADVVAPVPLHWTRLVKRRANQAAELVRRPELRPGRPITDLLIRTARTPPLRGKSRDERHAMLQGLIRANPARAQLIAGRTVLLVDDVMTTGATLSAAAEACRAAGARQVYALVVARVARAGSPLI